MASSATQVKLQKAMPNMNTHADVEKLKEEVLENLRHLAFAPGDNSSPPLAFAPGSKPPPTPPRSGAVPKPGPVADGHPPAHMSALMSLGRHVAQAGSAGVVIHIAEGSSRDVGRHAVITMTVKLVQGPSRLAPFSVEQAASAARTPCLQLTHFPPLSPAAPRRGAAAAQRSPGLTEPLETDLRPLLPPQGCR